MLGYRIPITHFECIDRFLHEFFIEKGFILVQVHRLLIERCYSGFFENFQYALNQPNKF
jgi:hypothetical protein